MKALLLKDFLVLWRTLGLIVVILLALVALPGLNMAAFGMVYAATLAVTTLSYDEYYHWDRLAAMLPFQPRQIVLGKYVLGYLAVGFVTVFSMLTTLIYGALNLFELPEHSVLLQLLYGLIATLLLALNLPMAIGLGREKGRLTMLLSIAVTAVLYGILAAPLATLLAETGARLSPTMLTAGGVLVILLANAASMLLSLRLYRRKRR